jgi:hypothetical protein
MMLALRLKLSQSGCILHDDATVASAAMTEGSVVTAVMLAPGCPRAQVQPRCSAAAHDTSTTPHVAPCASAPTAIDVTKHHVAGLVLSAPTSVSAASSDTSATHPSSAAQSAAQAPAAAALIVQQGSRVRIEGLQAAPEMNGRSGMVCGAFNQESGRWAVEVDADGARPACRGSFCPGNLRVSTSHNFSTEWVDEEGRVWPKNVDFSRECAKGHALAPLGERGRDAGGMRLMCRLCHSFCGRDCEDATSWLMCSVDSGCFGEYAVCCSCARASSAAAVACAGSDDLSTLVSCCVECCLMQQLTFDGAGRRSTVSVLAAVHVGLVAGPHDHVPVLSDVRAAVHVARPRQRDAAADGAGRHGAAGGRGDVVHQPHVE